MVYIDSLSDNLRITPGGHSQLRTILWRFELKKFSPVNHALILRPWSHPPDLIACLL
ncbi:unnamed protein product [Musa acuminata subsp. burmannicoides]